MLAQYLSCSIQQDTFAELAVTGHWLYLLGGCLISTLAALLCMPYVISKLLVPSIWHFAVPFWLLYPGAFPIRQDHDAHVPT